MIKAIEAIFATTHLLSQGQTDTQRNTTTKSNKRRTDKNNKEKETKSFAETLDKEMQ